MKYVLIQDFDVKKISIFLLAIYEAITSTYSSRAKSVDSHVKYVIVYCVFDSLHNYESNTFFNSGIKT